MAQASTLYKTKFRVENLIYEEILNPSQFEDLRIHGMESSVVSTLLCNNFTSAVVGTFKHKVEILSVIPHSLQEIRVQQVEAMDTEVNYSKYLFFLIILCSKYLFYACKK